jgi:hypothetical protein
MCPQDFPLRGSDSSEAAQSESLLEHAERSQLLQRSAWPEPVVLEGDVQLETLLQRACAYYQAA